MEILPDIHQIKLPLKDNPIGYVNTYLLRGTDGWLLIDTGWNDEESFEVLSSYLAGIGLVFEDIDLIVVTHIHPDHFGMAGRLKELSGAELAMHEVEKGFIDLRDSWSGILFQEMGRWLVANGVPEDYLTVLDDASVEMMDRVVAAVPDRGLVHGEKVSNGVFELEVIWTPGHSPGHVCLYERSRKLLFSGDHVLPITTPNVSIHVEAHGDPLGDYIRSLEEIADLDVVMGLPAHEETFTDLAGRIRELFSHHDRRKAEIVESVLGEAKTAFQISSELTWMEGQLTWDAMGPLDRRIAVTEALAHLEALSGEGRLGKVARGDVFYYTAT